VRAQLSTLAVCVLAVGCITNHSESVATGEQGLAEFRIDGPLPEGVTRVTVEGGTAPQDLARNPVTNAFDGTLFLTTGTYNLVARAFADDALVGQSQPTSVTIQPGVVTRVVIRILDIRPEAPPVFGPIFDSLTFPTTTEVNTPTTFALSVIAPASDPVTYVWSSTCADSTFSPPDAATTSWSKPTPGGCTIQVIAQSNGSAVFKTFAITVFPAGAATGAADVEATFVNRPQIQLTFNDIGCFVSQFSDASCTNPIASPSITTWSASVPFWSGSSPGGIEISDDCGGHFGFEQITPDSIGGGWLPPVGGGLCKITARATNSDGQVGTRVAAILTRPGTPPTPLGIQAGVNFEDGCQLAPSGNECGSTHPGNLRGVFGGIFFFSSGRAGTVTVTDSCFGAVPRPSISFVFSTLFFGTQWTVPSLNGQPSATCAASVHVTSLEGSAIDVSANYSISP
jgi:hypothetical protein